MNEELKGLIRQMEQCYDVVAEAHNQNAEMRRAHKPQQPVPDVYDIFVKRTGWDFEQFSSPHQDDVICHFVKEEAAYFVWIRVGDDPYYLPLEVGAGISAAELEAEA